MTTHHFNHVRQALEAFHKETEMMAKDNDEYAALPKCSERALFYRRQRVAVLIGILNTVRTFCEEQRAEMIALQKENADLRGIKMKLEGVCLLHGIHDVAAYMDRPENEITDLVLDAWANNWRQTPIGIMPGTIKKPQTADAPVAGIDNIKKMVA
jgi:hypothetical protein